MKRTEVQLRRLEELALRQVASAKALDWADVIDCEMAKSELLCVVSLSIGRDMDVATEARLRAVSAQCEAVGRMLEAHLATTASALARHKAGAARVRDYMQADRLASG
jgi:hypothetical protein